ncbi:MAG TPA: hypothetical protein VJ919_00620 [Tangfeifania sp.]|nr:hypothetical protein [Tangfeifania sp.]
MTTVDLKKKLIGRISGMKNNFLLEEIYRMVENEETEQDVYHFSKEEIKAIAEAREQYKKGQFISSKEADKEADSWLCE